MTIQSLQIALVERPHTAALGAIASEGYRLQVVFAPFEEVRQGFLGAGLWHAAEIPLGRYIALRAAGDESLAAIPVFPWRSFRHGAIHVRDDGSISRPADLEGRRVGVTDWNQTAGIVARGILSREYGVGLNAIEWVSGGLDGPARPEVALVPAPQGFSVSRTDSSLGQLLAAGEIDAIIAADPPSITHVATVPLLPNVEKTEADSFAHTGIFPLMHVIALRRTALASRPSKDELLRVFTLAKAASPLADDAKWRYGLKENLSAIEQLLEDAHNQGIGKQKITAEVLFN